MKHIQRKMNKMLQDALVTNVYKNDNLRQNQVNKLFKKQKLKNAQYKACISINDAIQGNILRNA